MYVLMFAKLDGTFYFTQQIEVSLPQSGMSNVCVSAPNLINEACYTS